MTWLVFGGSRHTASRRVPLAGLVFLAIVGLVAVPTVGWAQASVSGSVVDPSGGALPGATVTLLGPGPTRVATSGTDGHFHLAGVAAGTYKLTVTMPGFVAQTVEGVSVSGATLDVPAVTLQLASRGETIVVTASRVESTVLNAPVSVSVVTGSDLQAAPMQNMGDVLRAVPGMNVIQMSARDINVTSREPTNSLSNSQLALLDGRSLYLDFFGLILWDFVPANTDEIKQIEIVRGPASAVWGANALTGVVNIITKSPREMEGGSVTLQGGAFSRDAGSTAGQGSGGIFGGSVNYAHAPNDTISYRLSAGYYYSDAFPRPTGIIPLAQNPADPSIVTGGVPYPPYPNTGTKQPKGNVRVDQELQNGGRITYEGGIAGTQGIINSGIGPFDIQSGSKFSFGRVAYTRSALKLAMFGNFTDAQAPNLLAIDPFTGKPIQLNFKTQTYDFEVGNANAFGAHNLLSYGGNARRNNFDITIAKNGQNRSEFGAYAQEEIFYEHIRLNLGARVDKFGNLDSAVFSPRLAVILKPAANHSFRLSFNKAFRSPSLINNYIDLYTVVPVSLAALAPFLPPPLQGLVEQPFDLVSHTVGSEVRRGVNPAEPALKEESVKAYEVGYTGTFGGKTTFDAAFYINDHDNSINFITSAAVQNSQGVTGAFYTSQNPPPGWQLPPILLDILASRGIFLPDQFTYLNLGPYRQKGIEVGIQHSFNRNVNGFANYSYQFDPEIRSSTNPFPADKLSFPPKSRFNAGLSYDDKRVFGNVSVNYQDKAFWTDVLTDAYHGFTNSYTLVNAAVGLKWMDGRLITSVKSQNIANDNVQQHIFGDIIKRSIYGEVRITF